jgi:acetyl-CoA synthetase (ADP-forming)
LKAPSISDAGGASLTSAVAESRRRGNRVLDEPTGKAVLAAYGVPVPQSRVVVLQDEAAARAAELRPPYVLKVVSADVVHKSDVGGVKVGLRTPDEVARELKTMANALELRGIHAKQWLVEEMAPPGIEFVIGGVVDPEFGPMVMAGLGGVFVEVMGDVAFRICPIDRADALEMLDELRGAALLRGARGGKPVDVDAIVDVLLSVAGEDGLLMASAEDIAELDINPLIVSDKGAVAVDARFILRS